MSRKASPAAYIALVALCLFWGTTYLGIRIAIEGFPPAFVVCVRYLLSGSILLVVALLKGAHLPRGRELRVACVCGVMILGIGNGSVVFAEQIIPSGLASLFITTSPFWMVGFEAAMGGERLHAPSVAGMLLGFGGTVLLLLPAAGTEGGAAHLAWLGFAMVQTGMVTWTLAAVYQKRQPAKAHPIVTGAVQQLAAGVAFIPLALLVPSHPLIWTERSVLAVLYLVVFGSIVGYSAFIFSMDRLPVAIVSVYPYFNAMVAMGLGWLIFREPLGWREVLGMAVIFAGVGIVKWQTGRRRSKPVE